MKHLTMLGFALLLTSFAFAQDPADLYLTFEFMRVDESQQNAYWETETFWSAIHQQRANAGQIIGWDLWSLEPSGSDQDYQYMTVTLYKSFKDMIAGDPNFMANAKAAYPKMTDDEFSKKMTATSASRDLAMRVYLHQIDATSDQFSMPIGTMATIDFMQELDDDYTEYESEIFKPMHQAMVDSGKKGSWGLEEVLFPAGSDRYCSHITVNMYKDADQFASGGMGMGGDMSEAASLGIEKALESRDMKKVLMATLVKKVRAN